ncbi:hypothetical protein FJQ98_06885 [Lysinibacillus agricola]|uniref:DUF4367 domain-containing protein n=1 Tax=Lysinibacillus agricola TaxID=2590012 RepID=A0ABX7AUX3_9BACI|nr:MULTISPECIES: hypothetical protein [Lysinibacillus]KOS62794.1 hypothetical protein AN161_10785 [Lysinibacillus sp. FJAT-14222]QQP13768.1 hypothetical protein FJQ98_06885 [Lysinibacillus agricola]
MKKIVLVLQIFMLLFLSIQHVKAGPYGNDVVSNFTMALMKKDEKQARTYLSSNVKLPEIREETPIRRVSGLPSLKANVRVSLAYFDDGEDMPERIAFIWEITSNQEKITDIRVIYDGSNPFMNESKMIKEYSNKHKANILTASKFPFDITHVEGNINKDTLLIRYRNVKLHGLLQVKIEPGEEDLEAAKGENIYTLKNGIKALYLRNELIFLHDSLKYSIRIESEIPQDFTVYDLLEIANSMF